jgi:hypothetical protein
MNEVYITFNNPHVKVVLKERIKIIGLRVSKVLTFFRIGPYLFPKRYGPIEKKIGTS